MKLKPSKFEWLLAGVFFLFLFASWCFSDTSGIVGYEIDFADSILNGDFSNFYQRAYDRALYTIENNLSGRLYFPNYDLLLNFVIGIWGIPIRLIIGDINNTNLADYASNFGILLYGKSLFFFAFVISAFLVYITSAVKNLK